jgi:membrane protease YdiL (CAAX protease family)
VLLWSLPLIAVLAATNTVNEEVGYRDVPLAVLPSVVGTRGALAATGLLFGLALFYGNPPSASGVLLAAFLGVLLVRSMLETGGSKWAWLIHWLQDMVIFSFLALARSNLQPGRGCAEAGALMPRAEAKRRTCRGRRRWPSRADRRRPAAW